MSGPIDIIRSFHNAFRRDIFQIDDSVLKLARTSGDLTPIFNRLSIVTELLDYHVKGEDIAVFPLIDKLAPFMTKTYSVDHRELETMVTGLETTQKTPDPLKVARATAVIASELRIHLYKEDNHLYPFLREKTTESEQASIVGLMSKQVPPDKFPVLVQWLFPLLDLDDRVVITKGWMTLMPPQVFTGLKPLIQKIVAEKWDELIERIPELDNR